MQDTQKLRVAVTGGSGKVGREAVRALRAAGHTTVNLDRAPSERGATTVVDLTDFGQTMGALSGIDMVSRGFDAVVHLAAIPGPGAAPDHEVFRINTISTYNVFAACQRLGIRRVVWASSETLLGMPFQAAAPPFAPLDETVSRPEWSYALSKRVGEDMAETFARWDGETSIISLRFSNVWSPEDYRSVREVQAQQFEGRRGNLWSYIDARDCGEACRLAVERGKPGHHAYIIAAKDTIVDIPTAELVRRHFPKVPLRDGVEEFGSLLSSAKAAAELGFKPQHDWRTMLRVLEGA